MAYQPKGIGVLSTISGIDAKSATTTDLFIVPTGFNCIITGAIFNLTTATSVTIVGTMGIGVNGTQDDIFAAVALTGINATAKCFSLSTIGTIPIVAGGSTIKLGIDIGFTATTATMRVDLIGYLTT